MTSSAVAAYRPHETDGTESFDPPPPAPMSAPTFSTDAAGQDLLGRNAIAARLADLLAHRRTETPLTLAVFGPPGSGKSVLLRRVIEFSAAFSAGAGRGEAEDTFVSKLVVAPVDLSSGGDPAVAIAVRLVDVLGADYAAMLEDALHAGGDPREAAKRAGERSISLRRSLDGERQILDDFGARRARLAETVLFDTAGTRVDGFARTHRGRIEARLRAFGLPAADPLRTYKDLVRENAETSSLASRLGLAFRSLWGFKGQSSLLILAIFLFAIGWAAAFGVDDRVALSGWLGTMGDRFAFITDWERAHLDWLQPISQAARVLGGLAILAVFVRAFRFLAPILKGVHLLKADLAERRRDIDGLIAQQTRRIDGLTAEADIAARNAEQAERRLGSQRRSGLSEHGAALAGDLFGSVRSPGMAALAFCKSLSDAIAGGDGSTSNAVPDRILVAVDGIDQLPGPAAAAAIEAVHNLIGRPGFATVLATDRRRMAGALGETDPADAAARLDRFVHLSYDLDADAPKPEWMADVLIDPRVVEVRHAAAHATRTVLDRSLRPFEAELIKGLAAYAGTTPRALKRFVNAYRLARLDPRLDGAAPPVFGCLAWTLALDGSAAGSGLARFEQDAARGMVQIDKTSDLGRAFTAVHDVIGGDFTATDARRGVAIGRAYSRAG